MAFWDTFKQEKNKNSNLSRLHQKISELLPNHSENDLIKVACIAGLLARIAYVDLKIEKGEVETMKTALKEWSNLDELMVEAIVNLSVDEIKDLAGLENHKYCHPLNDILDNDEKFKLLTSLFAVAAGDGSVESMESEEIRVITKGLLLEHKHYIAARATVLEKLKALK